MALKERIDKLECLIMCMRCSVSGKTCSDNCHIQYDAGNMGEIIENLEVILKVLANLQEIDVLFTDNKQNSNTALRVYNDTLDECTCGNCLGYINKGYNYCPQCGARLEN